MLCQRLVCNFFIEEHLLVSTFSAAECFLTSIHEDVLPMTEILLASIAKAQEVIRRIHGSISHCLKKSIAAALHNAVIEYMSRLWVRAMRNNTSVILRQLHISGRETAGENTRSGRWWRVKSQLRVLSLDAKFYGRIRRLHRTRRRNWARIDRRDLDFQL